MKKIILAYLKINGRVKRKTLIAYLKSIGYKRVGTRRISLILNQLTDVDGLIIKADGKGIKLAESAAEYDEAIKYYRSYALSYLHKVRIAKRNYARLTASLVIENSKLVVS